MVVNAWLLGRRIHKQLGTENEAVPLLVFKTMLAEQLCNQGTSTGNRKIGRPRSSTPEHPPRRRCLEPRPNKYIQADQLSHWPVWTENRESCKIISCSMMVPTENHFCFLEREFFFF